ncbi:MAG TPA: hypothetical protein VNJ49_10265 [Bradyrhizobium sp.]|nr:hypothetical protein [Bradyrhizobium sp.]
MARLGRKILRCLIGFVELSQKIAAQFHILLPPTALAGSNRTGEFPVHRNFVAALIAGMVALGGGILIYKSQPHDGGRTTKAQSAAAAQ